MLLLNRLLPLLSLLSLSAAQSTSNASAVFVYDGFQGTEFIFALTADKSSGDLYFHMQAPEADSWIGVGIGSKMQGALMFIVYTGENGHDVIISPRIGTGHTEPSYQSDITVAYEGGNSANQVTGGSQKIMNASGVCKGCATWHGGSIDFSNKTQPFIFAVGPTFPPITSNSLSAGLSRHEFYGLFTMDMTAATVSSGGSVPVGPYVQKNASPAFNDKFDNDPAPHIHGLVMSLVFIILLPLGSLVLRVWNKVKGHIIVQCIALVLFCMALAGGVVISMQYNNTKNFNSAHQVIGILLLLALFTQLALGALHHRIYKKEQRKTIMGRIHLYLGPAIIFFGLVNGGLGFALAGAQFLAIPYAVIVLLFVILYCCVRCGAMFCRRRRNKNDEPEGFQYPQFGNVQQPYPPYAGAPPAYAPPYAQQDVPLTRFESSQSHIPLTRYESSQSVLRVDSPAVQPRPMI